MVTPSASAILTNCGGETYCRKSSHSPDRPSGSELGTGFDFRSDCPGRGEEVADIEDSPLGTELNSRALRHPHPSSAKRGECAFASQRLADSRSGCQTFNFVTDSPFRPALSSSPRSGAGASSSACLRSCSFRRLISSWFRRDISTKAGCFGIVFFGLGFSAGGAEPNFPFD